MEQLLASAEFQALAPFAVALIVALALRPLGWYWSGLGFAAAVSVLVALTIGFTFPPVNSNQKIVAALLAAAALGLVLDALPLSRRNLAVVAGAVAVGGLVWILWPVLQRKEGTELWLLAGGGVLFATWCAISMNGLRSESLRGAVATFVAATTIAVASVLGASGFYGQLAGSVAAAGGAMLLLVVLGKPPALGSVFMLPAGIAAGILGYASTVYAQVPWKVLPFVAAVPLLARIPLPLGWGAWLRAFVLVLVCVPAAVIAILLARGGGAAAGMAGY